MQVIKVTNTANGLQKVLDSLPIDNKDFIRLELEPGIYKEKVHILRSNLIITGTGANPRDTIITYDDEAFQLMEDGSKRGTFRSYTLFLDAHDVTLHNLTIRNESTDETIDGQGIALYAEGNNLHFENVHLIGRQDTLFTGPLPPKELQPQGFIGPKQFAPRINGTQYYKDCYICGNIDFIFGSATAYFDNCTIESIPRSGSADSDKGYVCAPSTPEGQKEGYTFLNCHFISSDCKDNTCYLARPWRNYAKAVFLNCDMGSHIHPDGFHDWNKKEAHDSIFFATKNCTRASSPFVPTAEFAKIYTSIES